MKISKIINIIIIFIAIIAISFGIYFYNKINTIENSTNDKRKVEISTLISKVSELYLFPEGEIPTIATVSDPSLLKNQAFFNNTQTDDKVLIFSKSGKAVLYRPSINKIIEIITIRNNTND